MIYDSSNDPDFNEMYGYEIHIKSSASRWKVSHFVNGKDSKIQNSKRQICNCLQTCDTKFCYVLDSTGS